jgi:hypothetical protein
VCLESDLAWAHHHDSVTLNVQEKIHLIHFFIHSFNTIVSWCPDWCSSLCVELECHVAVEEGVVEQPIPYDTIYGYQPKKRMGARGMSHWQA